MIDSTNYMYQDREVCVHYSLVKAEANVSVQKIKLKVGLMSDKFVTHYL